MAGEIPRVGGEESVVAQYFGTDPEPDAAPAPPADELAIAQRYADSNFESPQVPDSGPGAWRRAEDDYALSKTQFEYNDALASATEAPPQPVDENGDPLFTPDEWTQIAADASQPTFDDSEDDPLDPYAEDFGDRIKDMTDGMIAEKLMPYAGDPEVEAWWSEYQQVQAERRDERTQQMLQATEQVIDDHVSRAVDREDIANLHDITREHLENLHAEFRQAALDSGISQDDYSNTVLPAALPQLSQQAAKEVYEANVAADVLRRYASPPSGHGQNK